MASFETITSHYLSMPKLIPVNTTSLTPHSPYPLFLLSNLQVQYSLPIFIRNLPIFQSRNNQNPKNLCGLTQLLCSISLDFASSHQAQALRPSLLLHPVSMYSTVVLLPPASIYPSPHFSRSLKLEVLPTFHKRKKQKPSKDQILISKSEYIPI